jgi:cytochrome P450 family 6
MSEKVAKMDLFFSLIIVIVTLTYILYRKLFYYWKSLGVLQFPISSYKKGNLDGVGTEFHTSQIFQNYYHETKKLGHVCCGLYLSLKRALLICDLELAKHVLIKDFYYFVNHGNYCNEIDDPVSANLFGLEDAKWRSMRLLMTSIFTPVKLKNMLGNMEIVADTMLKKLNSSDEIEIKNIFSRYATDIIGSVAFGIDVNALNYEDIHTKFKEVNSEIFKVRENVIARMFRNEFPNLAKKLHLISLPESVSSFYINIVKSIIEMRENDPTFKREDFISILIDMKKKNLLTVEQIAAQSLIFYVAG